LIRHYFVEAFGFMYQLQTLYDNDFNLWVEAQLQALRDKRYDALDLPNLLEEIADLSKRQKQALRSHLKVLFIHLLKWQYQPSQRSNSWRASMQNARIEITDILQDSPSLRNYLPEVLEPCYLNARALAADETGLSIDTFPECCPYTLEQMGDRAFLPE
jgi:hypothetical protein